MNLSFTKRPPKTVIVGMMLVFAACLVPGNAHACTVIRFDCNGHLIVARNHDWPFGEGWLLVNPRGLKKKAITPLRPAVWTSRYGSVSLTQFGRGIPFAGMNERGLTVDLLQLQDAEFPSSNSFQHDAVDVIQWVQYQLDTSATVEDVIASLKTVWPTPLLAGIEKVHYFVTDASGAVAIIEFLKGKPVVHRGPHSENCALANTVHQIARSNLKSNPRSRYGRAVSAINDAMPTDETYLPLDQGFDALREVANPGLTQWNLVYEPQQHRLNFETTHHPVSRWLDLDDLDFDPGSPVQILSLQEGAGGDASANLRNITQADHAAIVNSGFDQYMPAGIGRFVLKQLLTGYPNTIKWNVDPSLIMHSTAEE